LNATPNLTKTIAISCTQNQRYCITTLIHPSTSKQSTLTTTLRSSRKSLRRSSVFLKLKSSDYYLILLHYVQGSRSGEYLNKPFTIRISADLRPLCALPSFPEWSHQSARLPSSFLSASAASSAHVHSG
jgi:hypothetical protein